MRDPKVRILWCFVRHLHEPQSCSPSLRDSGANGCSPVCLFSWEVGASPSEGLKRRGEQQSQEITSGKAHESPVALGSVNGCVV